MAPLHRLLVGLSLVLLLTGAAGVVTHRFRTAAPPGSGPAATPRPAARGIGTTAPSGPSAPDGPSGPSGPSGPATTQPPSSGPPGPGNGALEAGLVTPTDMGGYYRTAPGTGVALLASSSCLAPFGSAAAQSGRAVTALLGPDEHSVPAVVEEVASYPGGSARSRYQAAVAALAGCTSLSFDFGGPVVSARLTPGSIPPVGDADRVWSGSFTVGAARLTVQVGVVLSGQDVLALIWIDSVPPSDPVMGSFVSTVSLAIGKLA